MFSTRDCRSVDAAAAPADRPRGRRVGQLRRTSSPRPRSTLDARYEIAAARTEADLGVLLEAQDAGSVSEPSPSRATPGSSTGGWPSGWRWRWRATARAGGEPRTSCAPSPSAPAQLVRRYTGLRPRGRPARGRAGRPRRVGARQPRLLPRHVRRGRGHPGRAHAGVGQAAAASARRSPAPRPAPRSASPSGYLAQRVIGQYDVALIGPTREPRLLFVGAEPVGGARAPGRRPRALPELDRPARDHARGPVRGRPLAARRTWAGSPRSCSRGRRRGQARASCSAS